MDGRVKLNTKVLLFLEKRVGGARVVLQNNEARGNGLEPFPLLVLISSSSQIEILSIIVTMRVGISEFFFYFL